MTTLLLIAILAYLGIIGYLYFNQRNIIYLPDRDILPPASYGLNDFSEHDIVVGEKHLQLWYHKARSGFPNLIYFHGNATHLGNRAGIYRMLADKGFGLVALSYRGYGKSTGYPTEMGLYEDARLAIDYARDTLQLPLNQIILYGESLGTGVAVQMATEYQVSGLVLVAAYLSISKRAEEMYPFVPVSLLLKDRYDSYSKIKNVHAPLLQFHGEIDDVIPVEHGRKLFNAANEPKKAIFFPNISHNDFDTSLISDHVLAFAKEHELVRQ